MAILDRFIKCPRCKLWFAPERREAPPGAELAMRLMDRRLQAGPMCDRCFGMVCAEAMAMNQGKPKT